MRKFWPYLFALLALVLGFAIGAAWIFRMHTFLAWHQSSSSTSTAANLAVATLRSIRSGDTNKAIKTLEIHLNVAVTGLADICRENPQPETETMPLEALARARDYRAEFPHTTGSSVIDGAIARAFAVAAKTNKP
jgi:hypothetical protein